jgi:hypothetical protein
MPRFASRFFSPRQKTQESYERHKAEEEASRRADQKARSSRFHEACDRVRKWLAMPKVRKHWIAQMETVIKSTGAKWAFSDSKLQWPKDKSTIYAVMAICAEPWSSIEIIPKSIRDSEWYKANENIWNWVDQSDFAAELIAYIEQDLSEQGFLAGGELGQEDSCDEKAKAKRGRRPHLSDEQKQARRKLRDEWQEARAAGVTEKYFCADHAAFEGKLLTPKRLNAIVVYVRTCMDQPVRHRNALKSISSNQLRQRNLSMGHSAED